MKLDISRVHRGWRRENLQHYLFEENVKVHQWNEL